MTSMIDVQDYVSTIPEVETELSESMLFDETTLRLRIGSALDESHQAVMQALKKQESAFTMNNDAKSLFRLRPRNGIVKSYGTPDEKDNQMFSGGKGINQKLMW